MCLSPLRKAPVSIYGLALAQGIKVDQDSAYGTDSDGSTTRAARTFVINADAEADCMRSSHRFNMRLRLHRAPINRSA
eukprot:s2987_g2.t1